MLITPVSTASISETARVTLMRAQSSMADAQKELASGRYADIGLAIGARTSQTISFRQELGGLTTLQDTNRILSSRLQLTQSAMSDIGATADRFLNAALAAFSSEQGVAAAKLAAQDALKFMMGALNTAHDGAFVFAGLNTAEPPVADYFGTPVPASKQAVDLAFLAEFGVAQSSAGTEAITGAAMQSFLDVSFSALFDATGWPAAWSTASDENLQSRISQNQVITSSVNANEEAFRELTMAFAMVADLGVETVSRGAQEAILETASRMTTSALSKLNGLRAGIGLAQSRVESAAERISIEMDIYQTNIRNLESVDPTEVSVRIAALSTQIEASYALTARLTQMSLVNYL